MTVKRVDAFGIVQIGGSGPFRARMIQTGSTSFAIFPESGDPGRLELQDVPVIKGRMLSATLVDEQALVFQRASCGCQTPTHLKIPARRLLETLPELTDA
jgi:hypothetical protein